MSLPVDLSAATRLVADEIPARMRGGSRKLAEQEAVSLLLRALGTLNRQANILTMNIDLNHRPAALAIIPDTLFGQDESGKTILQKAETRSEKS